MRTPAIVAVVLFAIGLAGALFIRKPPPPPVPPATATPAPAASPDEMQSILQDGQELLSAPPPAGRGQRLAKRVRRARHAGKPVESARTAWKQVHDDARWVLAWIDAGLKHEQGDHETELTHYRDALERLEKTLSAPLPGEKIDDRVLAWGSLRQDALHCDRCPKAGRLLLATAERDGPAEARFAEPLDRLAIDHHGLAGGIDDVATHLDFPDLVDEDPGDQARMISLMDRSPMLAQTFDVLPDDMWNAAYFRWAPEPDGPGAKRLTTKRELMSLQALRQLRPEGWATPTKVLETMLGFAVDGLSNQSRDLYELEKMPLDIPEVRRTVAPRLIVLSQLLGKAQTLLHRMLDDRFPPLLRIKLVRAVHGLDRVSHRAMPNRRSRLAGAMAAVSDRPLQQWVTDLYRARTLHEKNEHQQEVELYARSFATFETRYLKDPPTPENLRAWIELRSTLVKTCSRRAEPPLRALITKALAASRYSTAQLEDLAVAHPTRAGDLRKLKAEEPDSK